VAHLPFRASTFLAGLAALALLIGPRISFAAEAKARRVLILHAFGHAYSPWSDMAASFRAELIKRSPKPIDLYEVSLDTARVQTPEDDTPFIAYIQAMLAGRKLDLIVPVSAPSAFFVRGNRQLLFPTTPVPIVGRLSFTPNPGGGYVFRFTRPVATNGN